VSSEKLAFYYASIKGVAVKLSDEQAKRMKENSLVSSIEADQKINANLPKPKGIH